MAETQITWRSWTSRREALTTLMGGGSASSATLRVSSLQRTASLSALRTIAWMRRTEVGDSPPG